MRTAGTITAIVLLAALPSTSSAGIIPGPLPWDAGNQILRQVQPPRFSTRVFRAVDYGAVGNGANDNTAAFANVINGCAQAGGGTVRVEPGNYVTGAIRLKSNVNFH